MQLPTLMFWAEAFAVEFNTRKWKYIDAYRSNAAATAEAAI